MELRPWLLWVVAAAGAVVLLAADAQGQKIFTNTWAVHIPGGLAVADRVAQKHGFHNLGQVGFLLGLFVTSGNDLVVERGWAKTLGWILV